jgi:hypothetical protein
VRHERVGKEHHRRAALLGCEGELSNPYFGFAHAPVSSPPGAEDARRKIDDDHLASTRSYHLECHAPGNGERRTNDQEPVQIHTCLRDRGGIERSLRVHPGAPRSFLASLRRTNDGQRHTRRSAERVRGRQFDDPPRKSMIGQNSIELGPRRESQRTLGRPCVRVKARVKARLEAQAKEIDSGHEVD